MHYSTPRIFSLLTLAMGAFCARATTLLPHAQPFNAFVYPTLHAPHAPFDINGDNVSDLLWFNSQTNQFAYWLTATPPPTAPYQRGAYRVLTVTQGYYPAVVADFTGSGRADVVWTSANDDIYFWEPDAAGNFSSTYAGTYPAGWSIIGAADMNGDGRSDLLWLNTATRQFAIWFMDGAKRISSRTFSVAAGYRVAGVYYMPSTKAASVVWIGSGSTRSVYDWDNHGDGTFTSSRLPDFPNGDVIVGFGGDVQGHAHLMALNTTDQLVATYYASDTSWNVGTNIAYLSGVYKVGPAGGNWASQPWSEPRSETMLFENDQEFPAMPATGAISWLSDYVATDGVTLGYNERDQVATYPVGWHLIGSGFSISP